MSDHTYADDRVTVNPEWILDVMRVPNLGFDGDLCRDERPGAATVCLFKEAQSAGALVIPDYLIVDCYSRDNFYINGFILIARPAYNLCMGVTRGWCDVLTVARLRGDKRNDNDPAVVEEALEFMAGKINAALSEQQSAIR
jgi:hypothetical protein